MALQPRPSGGRPAYHAYDHRHELYVRAAPVFRAFGYRQVTMKALAHACGITAPALYRYFPSKLDFALFPIEIPPQGYCHMVATRAAEAHTDPLCALRAALDAMVGEIDYIVLAVRLALEIGRDERAVFSTRDVDGLESDLAALALRYVPELGTRAHDLAHTLGSLVVTAAATNAELSSEVFWRQGAAIVRAYVVDAGVPSERFDAVFRPAQPSSAPQRLVESARR